MPHFAHVGLNCRKVSITEAFYGEFFGFERTRVLPVEKGEIVFLTGAGMVLELFEAAPDAPDLQEENDGPTGPGFRHLAFQVDDLDDFLSRVGAPVTKKPIELDRFIEGWRAAWIRDPDGRILEISQGYQPSPC
ncbi:MAG TPA: glyoxalase [Cyanobacteria bacterium UBA8530]|nr:glyoxalase [Cyanobacteria bacterium UBA8530]